MSSREDLAKLKFLELLEENRDSFLDRIDVSTSPSEYPPTEADYTPQKEPVLGDVRSYREIKAGMPMFTETGEESLPHEWRVPMKESYIESLSNQGDYLNNYWYRADEERRLRAMTGGSEKKYTDPFLGVDPFRSPEYSSDQYSYDPDANLDYHMATMPSGEGDDWSVTSMRPAADRYRATKSWPKPRGGTALADYLKSKKK